MTAQELALELLKLPAGTEVMLPTSGNGYRDAMGPVLRRVTQMHGRPGRWWPTSYVGGGSKQIVLIE